MSTIVYQHIQPPCNNESYFIESTTLSLKLTSPISQTCSSKFVEEFSLKFEYDDSKTTISSSNSSTCSWSEIEELSIKSHTIEKEEETYVYVHPLAKRSSFKLSEKSLEMCTESLCSETGTFETESSIFFPPTTAMEERRKPREKMEKRKKLIIDDAKFPPPLTSISGSNPIHVRKYHEDGRLVIEAVRTPPMRTYMQAERSNGRLKLSMAIDNEECANEDSVSGNVEDYDSCCDCQNVENEEASFVEEEIGKEEKSGECNRCDAYFLEDLKGITVEFGVRLGLGNLQRPSRCKEGGQGSNNTLINWEPFWVAT